MKPSRTFRSFALVLTALLVTHQAAASPVAGPAIGISPLSVAFGTVNVGASSALAAFVITNTAPTGSGNLLLNGVIYSDPSVPIFVSSLSLTSLRPFVDFPQDQCVATVQFAPTACGPAVQTITFNSDATNGPVSVTATGTGNTAPVINPPITNPLMATAGTLLAFSVTASDPCPNGPLTYSASPLPVGANFNTNSGAFSWIPLCADAGTYNVTFCVSDGLASVCQPVTMLVTALPCSATISRCPSSPPVNLNSSVDACFYIEPVGSCFKAADVIVGTVVMKYGSNTISATGVGTLGDNCPTNGTQDLKVCFSKVNLNALFGSFTGTMTVNVTVGGSTTSGCQFEGNVTFDVKK